jgi:hypothetical protein
VSIPLNRLNRVNWPEQTCVADAKANR